MILDTTSLRSTAYNFPLTLLGMVHPWCAYMSSSRWDDPGTDATDEMQNTVDQEHLDISRLPKAWGI